jgi:hypothetical protein
MRRAALLALVCLGCAGDPGGSAGRPPPADGARSSEAPGPLARALVDLQAPELGVDQRREALRVFIDLLLRSEVFVPASGPKTVGDASGAAALEMFTDAASLRARYPGIDAQAVEARDVLAQARERGLGVVVRHQGSSGEVFTGFAPADTARMLDL